MNDADDLARTAQEILAEHNKYRDALLAIFGALAGLRGEISEAADVDTNWEAVDDAIDVVRAALNPRGARECPQCQGRAFGAYLSDASGLDDWCPTCKGDGRAIARGET